jgi:hypothetical protein
VQLTEEPDQRLELVLLQPSAPHLSRGVGWL